MEETKKRPLIKTLRDKYRLIVYNDNTFEEVLQFRLSRLNLIATIGTAVILLVFFVTTIIAFTPIRELIPGYPDGNMRRNILLNAIKLDSLQQEIAVKDRYLENINNIISGRKPDNVKTLEDTTGNKKVISFTRSKNDSALRRQIEEEERFNLSLQSGASKNRDLSNLHFFTPIHGIVTNSFNPVENHNGTDVVAPMNEVIKATLDGVVIMASWTLETGYVIQIQHSNDLVSVYKHCANLLKKSADNVSAGEAIAIIGNSGELTTGPHLHFELWHAGKSVNPEDYIIF